MRIILAFITANPYHLGHPEAYRRGQPYNSLSGIPDEIAKKMFIGIIVIFILIYIVLKYYGKNKEKKKIRAKVKHIKGSSKN